MSTREELATAASTVPDVTCTPTYVQLTEPGQACVRLDRMEYPDGPRFGSVNYWNVVLRLPQDMAASEEFFEATVPALVAALSEHMAVTSAAPQNLTLTDGTTVLTAFINGFREE